MSSKQSNFLLVRTETNRNSICFGCFSVCFAKPKKIFSVCFGVSDRYRNNQNKHNFFETNQNNLQKNVLYEGVLETVIFFLASNQNKPKLNLFRLFFGLLLRETKKIFGGLFQCFGPVSKQQKQTELIIWGIKKVDILTNLLLFRLVFCLFQLF